MYHNIYYDYCQTMVQPRGIEPRSMVLQTIAMTTSAKVALGCLMGFEPTNIGITIRGLNRLTTSTMVETVRFELTEPSLTRRFSRPFI